ncbi:MAG TPA: pilus assembly protein TadG-related protein, partial [Sphingomicrobium sp.]|nr:pilus assembly protein TadG-related protein [Sphingomicrobium sp.]
MRLNDFLTVMPVEPPHAHRVPGALDMIEFIKRLWRDRRGNALVIAGAALPFVIGAAGLATDTIQWAMWKRELQRAADS